MDDTRDRTFQSALRPLQKFGARRSTQAMALAGAICLLVPKPSAARTRTPRHHVRRVFAGPGEGCSGKKLKNGTWKFKCSGFSATVLPDGRVRFGNRSVVPFGLGFTFDITDAIMRAKGQDPYLASKLQFLKATAAWRRALRRSWLRRKGREFLETLPKRLQAIVRAKIPVSQQKELLFLLWDECLEVGRGPMVQMARVARKRILDFAAKAFPRGSLHAYTRQELEKLNAKRTSAALFDPYGDFHITRIPSPRKPQ